jgi:hypothetical protein
VLKEGNRLLCLFLIASIPALLLQIIPPHDEGVAALLMLKV